MKNTVLLVVLVVAAVLVALFAFGVISFSPPGDGEPAPGPGNGDAPLDENGDSRVLVGRAPEDRPPLESFPLESPIRVLMLVGAPERFNATVNQNWNLTRDIEVVAWTAPPPVTSGTGPPPASALFGAWEGPPIVTTLDDKRIDVVFVHDLDPADVEMGFWDDLYDKVKAGRVGLLVVPGLMRGKAMLEHIGLRRLLPVRTARPIKGPEMPGIYRSVAPFEVTEAGQAHPASRLVQWPSWSRRIWAGTREGDSPWGVKFCYPVEELATGAVTLLQTDPPTGEKLPALVAGPEDGGRVLWFGGRDLGTDAAHRNPSVVADWRVLLNNWAVWLAGQAPN